MSKHITALALALLLAISARSFGQATEYAPKEKVDKLIAVLKSDAPQKEKADACRELAIVGTHDAIAALAALLPDEKLSHMARYGMETMPDPAVDDALRDALGKVKGRLLAGVIGSIGVRHDVKAIGALTGLLGDADPQVAQAAARALGNIGTPACAKAIEAALPKTAPANRMAFFEGLFRCAEVLDRDDAIALYDRIRAIPDLPAQVCTASLRGAILTREKEGLPLLKESLKSKDYVIFASACRISNELPGADVTAALVAELPDLSADSQILMTLTLGKRHDAAAVPALAALARRAEKPVRLAAIRAIAEISDASSLSLFAELMGDSDREISQLAQESLASLQGAQIDAAVVAMLADRDARQRLLGINLAGRRRMLACVPDLMKAAADSDSAIRSASLRCLGELASLKDLPAMLDLLMKSEQDLSPMEAAISGICLRAEQPESCVGKLTALLPQAKPAQKVAIFRILGTVGGREAFDAVRAAATDATAEASVRSAAIRALGTWKTTDAAPDLLALAKNAASEQDKMLCLRSYLAMAGRNGLQPAQRLTMCREAAALVQRPEEKKLLLGTLGNINAPGALALITPYMDDAATREEACSAAVNVADRLLRGRQAATIASRLIDPLDKVAATSQNADLVQRAKALAQQARNRAK